MVVSLDLELLTEILAKSRISSSQEGEILIAIKKWTTPPKAKEEPTSEELYTYAKEQECEKEIEEYEEGISGDHHGIKSCIKQCFQVSTSLNQFCFCFYFINLHFQHIVLHIFIPLRFQFVKLNLNFGLVLLHRWLHWQFHYT